MTLREDNAKLRERVKELEKEKEELLHLRMFGIWKEYPQIFEIEMRIGENNFEIKVHKIYRVFKARIGGWTKEYYNYIP